MSEQLTPIDILGPPATFGSGTAVAAAVVPWMQYVGILASIVGTIWGIYSIIKATYQFVLWCNKTAIPWFKEKRAKGKSD
jgi:hypothetical protein